MAAPQLPAQPIDGFVLEWWVAGDYVFPEVEHRRATYHANTAWADHPFSKSSGINGAPFVDQWAIYAERRPSGRLSGWDISKWVADCHTRRIDAVRATLAKVDARLASLRSQIAELERARKALEGRSDGE